MTSSRSPTSLVAGAAVIALAAGSLGYGLAHLNRADPAAAPAAAQGRKILYWYDPMVPLERYPGPGKSSMNMDLIPKYADAGPGETGVKIDPAAAQNLGMRLAVVERGAYAQSLDATGVLEFNQRDVAIIQAKAAGFVQRVHARAPGDIVAVGAPIVELLVPSWAGAQGEYLAVRRSGDHALEAATASFRRRPIAPPTLPAPRSGPSSTTCSTTTASATGCSPSPEPSAKSSKASACRATPIFSGPPSGAKR